MKDIPDTTKISEINIPGTHDSCTLNVQFPFLAKCQNTTISEQLTSGVRFLDIRVEKDGERLKLVHDIADCKNPVNTRKKLYLDDVITDCKSFLSENSSETILLSYKRDDGANQEETFDVFFENHLNKDAIWYKENRIPLLKEVRGKIVLLNRCGADINNTIYTDENTGINLTGWPYQNSRNEACLQKVLIAKRNGISDEYFYLQDFFNLKPKKKWEIAILPAIQNSPQDKSITLNFFSGNNGFSSPKRYSRIIFKRFFDYELSPMKKYGWFILDFPNKKIIKKIILSNY